MVALALYGLAWVLATPLVIAHLLWRGRRQPEYLQHWGERWAWNLGSKPSNAATGKLIWIHAVSVGETRAAQPLINALRAEYPQARILLTCMTPTGRQTASDLYGDTVIQRYLPYDYRYATRRFLRHWQPELGIIMETEIWPNLVRACAEQGVALCLVNARLSDRSLRKGLRWQALIRPAMDRLAVIGAQTEVHAQRLARLTTKPATVTGNLKFDMTPNPELMALGRQWRTALGGARFILAASTREGEESLIVEQWREQLRTGAAAGKRLMIVPRHPQRFAEVAALIADAGFAVARRVTLPHSLQTATHESTIWLGDSMGEMAAYYALADVALLGGSLLPHGGQNLIESCAIGTPVVMGEHTFNFEEAADGAISAGGAVRVNDPARSIAAALALVDDVARLNEMSSAGLRFTQAHRGATQRTMGLLRGWLKT